MLDTLETLDTLDIAIRPVASTRLPWRKVAGALTIVAVLVVALAYTGSRKGITPPFGPARNGLITWAVGGDVYAGDPIAGVNRLVVASPDIDRTPVFSRDGSHLAFLRQVPSQTGRFDLVVSDPDGNHATVLSPVPFTIPEAVEWAPDGRSLLVNDGDLRLTRYATDGSPSETVLEGVRLEPEAFRPPDGGQILFERDMDPGALYVTDLGGGNARQLLGPATAPCACPLAGAARWSPDGRMAAFSLRLDLNGTRIFVINADGTGLRQVAAEDGPWVENDPAWSPDGTRIAFNRWQGDDAGGWTVRPIAIASLDRGMITPVGVAPASEGALIEWAPDGRSILSLPATLRGAFSGSSSADGSVARPTLIDVADGSSRVLDWSVGSIASWQRRAP